MRTRLLTILLVFLGHPMARAEVCDTSPWLRVWPSYDVKEIQPRQIFLFSADVGMLFLEKELRQFGYSTQAYLWSAHDSVSLLVQDRAVDDEGRMQLLLRPSRPLLPGGSYELRASREQENMFSLFQQDHPFVRGRRGTTRYRWQIATAADTQAPKWMSVPAVTKKIYSTGDGYANFVRFSCFLGDSSACLIRTSVWHKESGRQSAAYLIANQNQLFVGWGDCGGGVKFDSLEECTVTFEALDAAGNRATASGAPIPFRAPQKVVTDWGRSKRNRTKQLWTVSP